jgi:hypothetical protein
MTQSPFVSALEACVSRQAEPLRAIDMQFRTANSLCGALLLIGNKEVSRCPSWWFIEVKRATRAIIFTKQKLEIAKYPLRQNGLLLAL